MNNTNPLPNELVDDNDTFIVGLGARVRVRPTVYLLVEAAPRVAGFDPGVTPGQLRHREAGRRPRFQINFAQRLRHHVRADRARRQNDDWYLGFNISQEVLLIRFAGPKT